MPKILRFPTQAARHSIQRSIQMYATGEMTLQQMMFHIDGILGRFKVTRMHIGNYVVRLAQPVITSCGIFPVVVIETDRGFYRKCPVCGCFEYRYLAGEAPAIKVWCMGCGGIYIKEVPQEGACEIN